MAAIRPGPAGEGSECGCVCGDLAQWPLMSPRAGRSAAIALGASVGGLDALRRVLTTVPAGLHAAVIALQHANPDRRSQLSEILDRAVALPVSDARDGDRLVPRAVLVAPSGFHMLVTAGRTIVLIPSARRPPLRPSADLLLTSLAVTVGADVIAVVLTGLGHDGAAGAAAVKRLGGTLIASDRRELAGVRNAMRRHRDRRC